MATSNIGNRNSAAALYTAHTLLQHYAFTVSEHGLARYGASLKPDQRCIAIILDDVMALRELCILRDKVIYTQRLVFSGSEDHHTVGQIALFFREVMQALEQVPEYEPGESPHVVST